MPTHSAAFLTAAQTAYDLGLGHGTTYDARAWEKVLTESTSRTIKDFLKKIKKEFFPTIIPSIYAKRGGFKQVAGNSCLERARAVAALQEVFLSAPSDTFPETFLTFGTVYHEDKNVFGSGSDAPATLQATDETFDLHCWITLSDLSVLDLTILPYLAQIGIHKKLLTNENAYLLWNSGMKSDLWYEPLLVSETLLSKLPQSPSEPVE